MEFEGSYKSPNGALLEEKIREALERMAPQNDVVVSIFEDEDAADAYLDENFDYLDYCIFKTTLAIGTVHTDKSRILAILDRLNGTLNSTTVEYMAAHEAGHLNQEELTALREKWEYQYSHDFIERSLESSTPLNGVEYKGGSLIFDICADCTADEKAIEYGYGNAILNAFEWHISQFDQDSPENPWNIAHMAIVLQILKTHEQHAARAIEVETKYFEKIEKIPEILEIADKKLYRNPSKFYDYLMSDDS